MSVNRIPNSSPYSSASIPPPLEDLPENDGEFVPETPDEDAAFRELEELEMEEEAIDEFWVQLHDLLSEQSQKELIPFAFEKRGKVAGMVTLEWVLEEQLEEAAEAEDFRMIRSIATMEGILNQGTGCYRPEGVFARLVEAICCLKLNGSTLHFKQVSAYTILRSMENPEGAIQKRIDDCQERNSPRSLQYFKELLEFYTVAKKLPPAEFERRFSGMEQRFASFLNGR